MENLTFKNQMTNLSGMIKLIFLILINNVVNLSFTILEYL